jgi:hypothetical protein
MKMTGPLIHAARRARRYPHLRTAAEIVGAVLLLSGGATAAASIAPSVTGTAIHGCVNTKTGALSILLKAGRTCPNKTKALSWNTAGPRGPQGPAGTAALFGSNTNKATTGSGGATCTLGQIILTAGSTASVGTLPADGRILPISSNQALFPCSGLDMAGTARPRSPSPVYRKPPLMA